MDFTTSSKAEAVCAEVDRFMQEKVFPAEEVFDEEIRASGDPHHHPAVMEDLKAKARQRGLWNLFHPNPEWGAGLTNLEYAPVAEITGPQPHRPRGVQLQRARHREHGGARHVRHGRAAGHLAAAPAGRRDPLGASR